MTISLAAETHDALRHGIVEAIRHLDHVLPGQAPIHDFVHHNTLHGFEHLPFEQALAEFSALTGIDCYWPAARFRDLYRQGRIDDDDIDSILERQFQLSARPPVCRVGDKCVTALQLYRLGLLGNLSVISPAQWHWQVDELGVLQQRTANGETWGALWDILLQKLELETPDLHPEQLLDLSGEQAERWLSSKNEGSVGDDARLMRQRINADIEALFVQVGDKLTLRGLLQALCGIDILDNVRPQLIRVCASLLDEGMAAWRLARQDTGLYQAWRQQAALDAQPVFQELTAWEELVSALPDNAIDAIAQQLQAMAIPHERWSGYLRRLALELPGWSGLINWRQTHPDYRTNNAAKPELADYLAIRLVLDRAHLYDLCRKHWHCEPRLDKLQAYFGKHGAEFVVRQALFNGELPEYLAQTAQTLLGSNCREGLDWSMLAERIWTWRQSPLVIHPDKLSVYDQGWRLLKACDWLQLSAAELAQLSKAQLLDLLRLIDGFNERQRGEVWLQAYERHYRQVLLRTLHANRRRGRWARRDTRPQAQIFFCMDEREESFRRHLEELNPAIETLGAAGFFGVAMNYKPLDAHDVTPLCPVVVKPAHRIDEVIRPGQAQQLVAHAKGLHMTHGLAYQLYQNLRASLVLAYPLLYVFAPVNLLRLLGKTLWPTGQRHLELGWQRLLVPKVATQLHFVADDVPSAKTQAPKLGFTDQEQADRVAQFLRTTGLTYGFAPIVALMGHGSTSQNNPHEAAHDCGACGGRQGGPNARVFAAMANRPEVRRLLAERGISIPDDTWFVGAQHDTCSDIVTWFDTEQIPSARRDDFARVQACVLKADGLAAQERCRRFAGSKPRSGKAAIRAVENRAMDLSQVRPEFGHATNAAAYIGRRAATQGAFFDRRLFLISYDPTQDADGTILENILLTAGPVGAGINLEYYFSSVNNERLGCGTKIPHNVTGLFGVMEGAGSDLRTGLPLQMVEIHEPMRLQIVVESKTAVLEAIYAKQEGLRELIGGGWMHLSAQDPESGEIFLFERGIGFVPWHAPAEAVPERESSKDCYRDETGPIAPMLIQQINVAGGVNG